MTKNLTLVLLNLVVANISKKNTVCRISQKAKFMGPTWGPPGSCWPQVGPMLPPWTLLSGLVWSKCMASLAKCKNHLLIVPWLAVILFCLDWQLWWIRMDGKTKGRSLYYCYYGWIGTGGRFNISMLSFQNRESYNLMILWLSYLYNGISVTGKMISVYWIRAQVISFAQ